ncbi:YcjF family protein [Pseudodesulfovibrio portus]|uniref:DUF697 domain-containing protein n=1 Tax=Pseudodesulfovibrio portus TaxID=231439 RepID=A0ABM8AU68_9BACT|nr:YcjF family protein [Pseudodesulfovibrio portus]BDQ34798.1 hypothetical protein JCM14722_23400 [Pseudodesulfovibrio portus]
MSKSMKNFLTLVGVIVIGAFLVFVYDCIAGLADFAGRIRPEFTPFVFWGLALPTAATLLWWVVMALMRPKPIMVHANPTEEELAGFRQQLVKRLTRNKILKDNGVAVRDESGLDMGLMVLRDRADEEIRSTAKRVFIGTAVSQNGRLDALVVLYLITRLVWRISKLYDQRPHHRELINLYANIAATAFLAGSLDEFGIEDTIHELIGPLMAGSALGAVPGAEAVAGTITASILTGSTNALLAMRCGIVARNYMSLDLNTKGQMRRSATLEAARMFMTISGETVSKVTRLLVRSSSSAAKKNARRVARSVVDSVAGAAGSVGKGAKKATGGVTGSAKTVGRGVTDKAKSVVSGVDRAADRLAVKIKDSARKVEKAAKDLSPALKKAEARVDKVTGKVASLLRTVRKSKSQKKDPDRPE